MDHPAQGMVVTVCGEQQASAAPNGGFCIYRSLSFQQMLPAHCCSCHWPFSCSVGSKRFLLVLACLFPQCRLNLTQDVACSTTLTFQRTMQLLERCGCVPCLSAQCQHAPTGVPVCCPIQVAAMQHTWQQACIPTEELRSTCSCQMHGSYSSGSST
jgi:hypothetical protein